MKKAKKKYSHKEKAEILNNIAHSLSKQFINAGIKVLRYDAYTTNSIYLKLDNGLLKSIRISDHDGKSHLRYRYNVRIDLRGHTTEYTGGVVRHYFGIARFNLDLLVSAVMSERKRLIQSYTANGYQSLVRIEGQKNKDNYGFWTKAVEVK